MPKQTYYGIRLIINGDRINPLALRALKRIIDKHGGFVSMLEIADSMFGVDYHKRSSTSAAQIESLRYDLDELSELNSDLIESGDLDPVRTYWYRITAKAIKQVDGGDHDKNQHRRGRSTERH